MPPCCMLQWPHPKFSSSQGTTLWPPWCLVAYENRTYSHTVPLISLGFETRKSLVLVVVAKDHVFTADNNARCPRWATNRPSDQHHSSEHLHFPRAPRYRKFYISHPSLQRHAMFNSTSSALRPHEHRTGL